MDFYLHVISTTTMDSIRTYLREGPSSPRDLPNHIYDNYSIKAVKIYMFIYDSNKILSTVISYIAL